MICERHMESEHNFIADKIEKQNWIDSQRSTSRLVEMPNSMFSALFRQVVTNSCMQLWAYYYLNLISLEAKSTAVDCCFAANYPIDFHKL
jgi:hypothetical protein